MVPVDPASSSRDIETQLARVSPKIGFYAARRADTYLAGVAEGSRATDRRPGGDRRGHPGGWTTARRRRLVRSAGRRGSRRAARPPCRDVHVRHHGTAEGRRADPGQLLPRRRSHGGRGEPRCRRPVAGHVAAVPRERPVLLLRTGDQRGRVRRPHRHLLGEPVDRHGQRARRHARQPLRRSHPHDPGANPRRHHALPAAPHLVRPEPRTRPPSPLRGARRAHCHASCTE